MKRSGLLLGLVSGVLALTSFACDDGVSTGSVRRGGYVPAAGEQVDHDPNDVDDGDGDPGNPNATTPPPAPGDPAGQGGEFTVGLSSTTPAVDLGASATIDVSITGKPGFTGEVDLSATGLPAGVTAAFAPAKVTVGAGAVTSKLTLTTAYTAIPSAPNASTPIQIVAKSAGGQATANANFKVNPRLTLTIPMNVDALRQAGVGTQFKSEWGAAFGATPTQLRTQEGNGIVVVVRNADSTAHIIHSGGAFPHGDTGRAIQPLDVEKLADGTTRTRTLSPTAASPINVSGYPHEGANGPSVSFRIGVAVAP